MNMTRTCLIALALLAGCAVEPPVQPAPAAPAPLRIDDAGEPWYPKARQAGEQVWTIDPAQSLITVTVRRSGALARLGHDHVVASRTVTGYVAPRAGRADFHFRLDQMTVDEAALRTAAGLDTTPTPEAIEGTRANMLKRVLDAEAYPLVTLSARTIASQPGLLRLGVTLHGVTRSIELPVRMEYSADRVVASGTMRLKQTDFGITPMSVMGGAIAVQDAMELAFRIVAIDAPLP